MIRKAEVQDGSTVAKLKVDTWRECYKGLLSEKVLQQMNYEEETQKFLERIEERDTWIAENEKKEIVGFVAFGEAQSVGKEKSYTAEIYSLYVRQDERRKGIGEALFKKATEQLKQKGHMRIILWCLQSNQNARGFYENMAGKNVGRQENILRGERIVEVGYGYDVKGE